MHGQNLQVAKITKNVTPCFVEFLVGPQHLLTSFPYINECKSAKKTATSSPREINNLIPYCLIIPRNNVDTGLICRGCACHLCFSLDYHA